MQVRPFLFFSLTHFQNGVYSLFYLVSICLSTFKHPGSLISSIRRRKCEMEIQKGSASILKWFICTWVCATRNKSKKMSSWPPQLWRQYVETFKCMTDGPVSTTCLMLYTLFMRSLSHAAHQWPRSVLDSCMGSAHGCKGEDCNCQVWLMWRWKNQKWLIWRTYYLSLVVIVSFRRTVLNYNLFYGFAELVCSHRNCSTFVELQYVNFKSMRSCNETLFLSWNCTSGL